MSWLPNPETIMSGLMKSMGVSVEDFAGFIGTVMTEMRELRADRLAFRPASIKAYQELTARMERMETKLDRIVTLCEFNLLPPETHDGEPADAERHEPNSH